MIENAFQNVVFDTAVFDWMLIPILNKQFEPKSN